MPAGSGQESKGSRNQTVLFPGPTHWHTGKTDWGEVSCFVFLNSGFDLRERLQNLSEAKSDHFCSLSKMTYRYSSRTVTCLTKFCSQVTHSIKQKSPKNPHWRGTPFYAMNNYPHRNGEWPRWPLRRTLNPSGRSGTAWWENYWTRRMCSM